MKRILLALLLCTASVRAGDILIFNAGLGALTVTGIAEAVVSPYTNGAALGATALQPSWDETGTVFRAIEVIGAQSTLIETAWQNPTNAADWTWASNGREITLTGYSGPNAVVIPDMLDGLPVTGFGGIFTGNTDITSVGGGANVKAVDNYAFGNCTDLISVSLPACTTVGTDAFYGCEALISVSLPACTTVGTDAFYGCEALISVSLPACTTVGDNAFLGCSTLNSVSLPACTTVGFGAFQSCGTLTYAYLPACTTVGKAAFAGCATLNSVSLPACTTVGDNAFLGCTDLISVTFGQNAPAPAASVFVSSTPTIYVSNPHATGWGDTWNGRPVVRAASMPDIASHNASGTAHADIREAISSIPTPFTSRSFTFLNTNLTSTTIYLTNYCSYVFMNSQVDLTSNPNTQFVWPTLAANEAYDITFYFFWNGGSVPTSIQAYEAYGLVPEADLAGGAVYVHNSPGGSALIGFERCSVHVYGVATFGYYVFDIKYYAWLD